MDKILEEIKKERIRQDKKFGKQDHSPIEWIAILSEEVGEASREAVDHHFEYGLDELKLSGRKIVIDDIQDNRMRRYRKELIQVAAVAVQMIECLDRNEAGI